MGTMSYGLNDALAVKLWSKKLAIEATKALDIAPLFGESARPVIQVKTETQKGSGDKVTFGLRMQFSGNGFTSPDRAEGNGETLTTNSDAISIDELGNFDRHPLEEHDRLAARAVHTPNVTVNGVSDHAHTIPADGSYQHAITAVGDHRHSVAVNLGGQDAAHPNIPPGAGAVLLIRA